MNPRPRHPTQVPVLRLGDVLIASIRDSLTDADLLALRDNLVLDITEHRSRGVIIDVTGLDVMDSFAVHTLSAAAQMIRLRGAETVIVGIQPEVAIAMVQLGLSLTGIHCALDLDEGLAFLKTGPQRRRTDER